MWVVPVMPRRPHDHTDSTTRILMTKVAVAVGGAGVWGLAKDNTLWFRGGTAGRTDSVVGESWTKVQVSEILR